MKYHNYIFFGVFFFVLSVGHSVSGKVVSAYSNKNFGQQVVRITKGSNYVEYFTRRMIFTRLGPRVYHCVRDEICYRVDPEHMLIYRDHYYISKNHEKGSTWLAMQPDYLRPHKKIVREHPYLNLNEAGSHRKRHGGVPEIKDRFYNHQNQVKQGYPVNYNFSN